MSRPFIPAANTVSVEMIYAWRSVVLENVLHVQKNSPFSAGDITALRGVFTTWFGASWKTVFANVLSITRIRTKALDSASAPMEDYSLPAAIAGTLGCGTSAAPSSACVAIKLATGLTGRSYRGRLYVPLTCMGNIPSNTSNDVDATWVANVITSLNALKTAIAAWNANAVPVVASFRHDKDWRAVAVCTPVTAFVAVDYHLDAQRRRLTGRGI